MTPLPQSLGTVASLWRYPIKSLGGEVVDHAILDSRGLSGDRAWAIVGKDGKIGSGKTTKRFRRMPGLLTLRAINQEQGVPLVEFPDGSLAPGDLPATLRRIAELVGEEVQILPEAHVAHHDDAPVHLITTRSLAWLSERHPDVAIEPRRFRPNLVIETTGGPWDEEGWLGTAIRIGSAIIRPIKRTERCVMVTMAQPGLTSSPALLGDLDRNHDTSFGVYARVEHPGDIKLGDPVEFVTDTGSD
jgi:uncharacterized protein YcbX